MSHVIDDTASGAAVSNTKTVNLSGGLFVSGAGSSYTAGAPLSICSTPDCSCIDKPSVELARQPSF